MKNFVQPGENVTVPAPADTASGDLVLLGAMFGVAVHNAGAGEPVTVKTGGIFDLPAIVAEDWGAGVKLYRHAAADANQGKVTGEAAGNVAIGIAMLAKPATFATARVRLNPAF